MNPVFILLANENDELLTLNASCIVWYRDLTDDKTDYVKKGCKSQILLITNDAVYVKESTAAIADKIKKAVDD
jgi:hypothetical protein